MLERVLGLFCLFSSASWVKGLDVYNWPGETLMRIDPNLDLGISTGNATSKLILPDGFESTEAMSTSESLLIPMGQRTTLMSSFMTNGTNLMGVAYQRNNSFFIDRRLFDDFRSDTNLTQTTYLGSIFGNASYFNEIDTNCFDSRLFDNDKYVFACKQFFPTNGSAFIRVLVFQYFSNSNVSLTFVNNSGTYLSNSRGVHGVTWTGYIRSTISCDMKEDLLVLTDVAYSSYSASTYSGPTKLLMFLFGFGQSSTLARDMGLSDAITLTTSDIATSAPITVSPVYVTNTFAVTTNSGQTTCKNVFYLLAEMSNNNKYNCFADANVDDTIVTLVRNLVTPAAATFDTKCQLVETMAGTNYGMEKVFRSGGNIEVFLRAKAILNPAPGLRKIIYEAGVLKPAEIVISSVSTHFRFVELNSSKVNPTPNFPQYLTSIRVIVVIPEKLVYVCWRAWPYLTVIPTQQANTTLQNCQMIDVFNVDPVQFSSTDVTSTQMALTFIGRFYGPFISLNFDADPSTFMPKRMIGFQQFIDSTQFFNSDKSFLIYDLSLPRNCFKLSNGPAIPNNTNIFVTDLDDLNPMITVRTMQPADIFMSMLPNISNVFIGFKNQTWVSFEALADRLFAQNSQFSLTAANTSLHTPKIVVSWRHSLTYTANATLNEKTILIDKKLVQFTSVNGTFTLAIFHIIYTSGNGTNSDGAYSLVQPPNPLGGSWSTMKDNYQYANLLRAKIISNGLYLYFGNTTANNVFPVVRFDLTRYIFTTREFPFPVKVFESFSRIFMVYLDSTSTPQRIYWGMVPETVDKNLGYSDPRNWTWNFTLDTGYKINNLTDFSINLEKNSKSILLNVITETTASFLHKHVLMVYAWDDQTIYDKTGPVVRKRRTIDITGFLAGNVFGKNKCTFFDGVIFLNLTTGGTSMTVTKLNTTTFSLYTYTETVVAGGGNTFMQCADSHAMIVFDVGGSYKSVLYRQTGDLESYKRIRSVTTSTAIPLQVFAFSPNSFTQVLADNNFLRIEKFTTKIYLSANTMTSYNPEPPLVNTSDISTTLKLNGYSTNVVLKTQELTKPAMLKGTPIYVGNETIELQKKIRYESSMKTSYPVEDYFKLPMSFFDIRLKGNIPSTKISVLERVRWYSDIDLWKEAVEFNQKRCRFGLRGSNMASIMDDVMLRVDVDDNSFCMQLSRIGNANGGVSMLKYNDFQQSNGYVKMCRLTRDMSLFTPSDVAAKRAAGQLVNYAISCIYVEADQEYFWMLLVPLGESFDNIFKPIDNLVKWTIPFNYTSYDMTLCENSAFVTFHNKDNLRLWYLKSIFTYGPGATTLVPTFLPLDAVYAHDTLYTVPTEAGKKVTGIILMAAIETSPGTGAFVLDRYRILSSGDLSLSVSERSTLNQTIDRLSCAYQNAGGLPPFMNCAYLSAFSRSTIYYTVDMLNSSALENYVAPLLDLEVRQLKTIYLRRYWYVTVSHSPLTGRLFLIFYKHISNSIERDPPPQLVYNTSIAPIIIHDSVEITNSNLDPETCEVSMFTVGGDDYMSVKDGNKMMFYKFNHFEISIDGNINFQDIANTKLVIVDHMEIAHIEMFLSLFFREKVSTSLVWVYVLGAGLLITVSLVLVYLFFKKRNMGLEKEINSKITENNEATSAKKSAKIKSKTPLLDKNDAENKDGDKVSAEVELNSSINLHN